MYEKYPFYEVESLQISDSVFLLSFLHLHSRDLQSEASGFVSTLFHTKHVTGDSSHCPQAWDNFIPNVGMIITTLQDSYDMIIILAEKTSLFVPYFKQVIIFS